MTIDTKVITPETGRPGETVPTGTGTNLPNGTEDSQLLQWDNVNKVARWVSLRSIIPDAPVVEAPQPEYTPPSVNIADFTVIEPALGSTAVASFALTLSKPGVTPIEIDWKTVEATAKAGTDFQPGFGTLVFAPGETLKSVSVLVLSDTLVENDEEFGLLLTGARGATINRTLASCKIISINEPPPVVIVPPTPSGSYITLRDGSRLVDRNGNPILTR